MRTLLLGGTLRLACGLVELRGSQPVITTLGDLKRACGVAVETIKQGLRALEMEHWVLPVDGMHTRLLGPPRFRLSVTKENIAGSVGRAISVAPMDGLDPLESIDYDSLRICDHITSRKRVLAVGKVAVRWTARLRLAGGAHSPLMPQDPFTLAAGSQARSEGRLGVLACDLPVTFQHDREVRAAQPGRLLLETGAPLPVTAQGPLLLERSNIIRLPGGQTGLLEVASHAGLEDGGHVDWEGDSHWLARFPTACR